mmetsp:Transcript_36409/g.71633  ORF Transcript_36409/g.71633 Transcript_36409/m.71633 type:complete len:244 (-) Transcript_36409:283-1014(-)
MHVQRDLAQHPRPLHLHGHLLPRAAHGGLVHLPDRRRRHRLRREGREGAPDGGPELALHRRAGLVGGERRHGVLEQRQARGVFGGEEIRAGAEGLAHLHEGGAEPRQQLRELRRTHARGVFAPQYPVQESITQVGAAQEKDAKGSYSAFGGARAEELGGGRRVVPSLRVGCFRRRGGVRARSGRRGHVAYQRHRRPPRRRHSNEERRWNIPCREGRGGHRIRKIRRRIHQRRRRSSQRRRHVR